MEAAVKMMMRKAALPFVQLIAVLFMVLVLSSAVPAESTRQLLQRGPVRSGPNGCSHRAGGSASCVGRHG
ncbi:unnamed protein product [Linum trigynum]|uniref:Uncharacterized protein n=1 Tax=Linum trigynum TaxID=586398 RepID=A0AAV2F4E8_9ROSI